MKIKKTYMLFVLCSLLVLACNNNESKSNAILNSMPEKSGQSDKHSAIKSPCELVSLNDVKSMFAVEIPIEVKDVVYTYPTCVYKWEDGKVFRTSTIAGQEIKGNIPSEVLIVMVKNATEDMFNRSTTIYKQPQEISNLGSKAIWDSRMAQLTFLSNKYLFHVHIRVTNNDNENKEKAIEVSRLIIGKL